MKYLQTFEVYSADFEPNLGNAVTIEKEKEKKEAEEIEKKENKKLKKSHIRKFGKKVRDNYRRTTK